MDKLVWLFVVCVCVVVCVGKDITINETTIQSDAGVLAIERVSGTPANREVRDWLIRQFPSTWTVETDTFNDSTPLGTKEFSNIIATRTSLQTIQNPSNPARYVIAAHYDSKYYPSPHKFVGATDSAVPCAMILELVRALEQSTLRQGKNLTIDLQVIFFDGEEAFLSWSSTDSLYGSRHLSTKWSNEKSLSGIQFFNLLDLIAGTEPTFYSYWKNTDLQFQKIMAVENTLKSSLHDPSTTYFKGWSKSGGMVDDDHRPFLNKGVPILHLISLPFPAVWHTDDDTLENVDWPKVFDITNILTTYYASLLGNSTNTIDQSDVYVGDGQDSSDSTIIANWMMYF